MNPEPRREGKRVLKARTFRVGPKFTCATVDRIEYPTLLIANH